MLPEQAFPAIGEGPDAGPGMRTSSNHNLRERLRFRAADFLEICYSPARLRQGHPRGHPGARGASLQKTQKNQGNRPLAAGAMNEQEILREKLGSLRSEHRDLDDVIARLVERAPYDQLQMQRLKKRKLMLKDQIMMLESRLLPDIIA